MYRILSIEDDPVQEATLRAHLKQYGQAHALEYELIWEQSAFEFAGGEAHYDLVFLDIDLPGINGMEAAEALRSYDSETPVIFVTNLAQYAVRGYAVDALDFMVKPVSYQDFVLRMDKALRVMERNAAKSIMIQTAEGLRFVPARIIAFVDIANHELAYHFATGEVLRVRETLASAEEKLGSASFVRISKSCLVNMAHIKTIRRDELALSTGDSVWFSRSRKKPALEAIARYAGGSI